MKIKEFNGIKILDGINTYPGSGPSESPYYNTEISALNQVLARIETDTPVMIEVGCFWALWSLIFRKTYPKGKNILIELGKRQLDVGESNFRLNEYDFSSHWGGLFLEKSGTYQNKDADIEYLKEEGEHWNDEISGETCGPELNFSEIYAQENLDVIDLFHMDIQASELSLCKQLQEMNLLQPDRIKNFIIATHSREIHMEIQTLLDNAGYDLFKSTPVIGHPLLGHGEDGLIVAGKLGE